jgi:hypothetical protein
MEGIVGHKIDDNAVACADLYIIQGSNKKVRQTTKGWHLCVEWKDGLTSWEILAELKESNPIEVTDAVSCKIDDDPAFLWWVPYVLKKRNRLISVVTKRYHKRTHKFGIVIPKIWDEAMKLDKENGNTLWQDSIRN